MATREELIAQGFVPDEGLSAEDLLAAGFVSDAHEDDPEEHGLLYKVGYVSPAIALARLTKPARKMAVEAFKVGRANAAADLREGVTPWTPDIPGIADITVEIDGKRATVPGMDTRLKQDAEKIRSEVDEDMRDRVSRQLSEGKLWPVHPGQPWYKIDPELVPEAVNTWAASVGSQAAILWQQLGYKVLGSAAGAALTKSPKGATVGGITGQAATNISNQTAEYMHDAEFWGIADKKIMEENARYYGLSSGLIEYAQNAVELAATKGLLKVGVKEAAKRKLVVRGLEELGINVGEGLTEVSQAGLERFFLRRAAGQMKTQDPNFKMPDIPDTFAGAGRTFAQAAGTSAVIRGGGKAAVRVAQHTYQQEQTKSDQLANDSLAQEEQAPEAGPELRVVPEIDAEETVGNRQLEEEGEAILTAEEQAAIDQLEQDQEDTAKQDQQEDVAEEEHMVVGGGEKGTPQGNVSASLYIGNVTPRAKKVWAELLTDARAKERLHGVEVKKEDIGPHREGAFPTKRTGFKMTVDEARNLEGYLTDAMDEALAVGGTWSSQALAMLKALWGDIREVRTALGLPPGRMPFRVISAGKTRVAVVPNTTERIYMGIEGPNKRVLAELSHADLVTEGQALNMALKKAAVAAKHAYSVGDKEGQKKIRDHVRVLKRKARAIKLAKTARKVMTKKLMRRASSRIDPRYRQAIEAIRDRIDPKHRTANTQEWMTKAQAEYERDPERFLRTRPKDVALIRRGQQVPVGRMSTRQLQALVDERKRLAKEGRGVADRAAMQRDIRLSRFVEDAIATLDAIDVKEPLAPGQEEDNATVFELLLDRLRSRGAEYDLGYTRPDRFFRYLDGGKRGVFARVWEKIKTDLHTSRERRSIRIKDFIAAMKDQQINGLDWMQKVVDFRKSDGTVHKLTALKLLGAWVQAQNEDVREHLIEGNKFSEEDLRQINQLVEGNPQMLALANWMDEQQKEQFRRVLEVCRSIGMDDTAIREVKRYLPLLLTKKDLADQNDLLRNMLGAFVPQEVLPKGFLKERTPGARQPIELDAMMLYMHSSNQVEHFIAMANTLKMLGRMLADPKFRERLDAKTHNHGADILTTILTDVGRDRLVAETDLVSRLTRWLQNRAMLHALAYNAVAVLRQLPALLVGLAEDARMLTKLVDNVLTLASHEEYTALREDALHKSKVLKHRNVEYEIRSAHSKSHRKALMQAEFGTSKIKKVLSPQGMQFMRIVDDWCTTLIWKCKYDVIMEETGNEQTAIRLADTAVQKTQQMASPEDLPHLFRGGTWHKVVNVFMNQSNQEWNFLRHDIVGELEAGNLSAAQIMYRVLMASVLPGMLFTVLGTGGAPVGGDEEENKGWLLKGTATYQLGNIPLVGIVVSALGRGRSGQLWQMPIDGMMQIYGSMTKEEPDWVSFAKGTAKVVGTTLPTKGLVNAQFIRTIEGAWDLREGNTEDVRRLAWSKTMRGEKRKQQ